MSSPLVTKKISERFWCIHWSLHRSRSLDILGCSDDTKNALKGYPELIKEDWEVVQNKVRCTLVPIRSQHPSLSNTYPKFSGCQLFLSFLTPYLLH